MRKFIFVILMLFSVNAVSETVDSVTLIRPDGTEQRWDNIRLRSVGEAGAIFYSSEGDKHYVSGTFIVEKKTVIERDEATGLEQPRKGRWNLGIFIILVGLLGGFIVGWRVKRRNEYDEDDEV